MPSKPTKLYTSSRPRRHASPLRQPNSTYFVHKMLIRAFPEFALAYDSLAVALSKSGRAQEAVAFHQKAISLAPRDASFYYNFAVTYLILGDARKAQEQMQKLRALDPAMAEHLAAATGEHQREFTGASRPWRKGI